MSDAPNDNLFKKKIALSRYSGGSEYYIHECHHFGQSSGTYSTSSHSGWQKLGPNP
jgi:hypothetical protein